MYRRWVVAGLIVLVWGGPAWAERDVSGSADHRLFTRFPYSWIVEYRSGEVPEYLLALGAMEKFEGVIRPEVFQSYQGVLSRITYQVPSGHSADEVFAYFKRQLDEAGATLLFSCTSRQCGSSNQWANNLFGVPELYGLDRTQSYLAAQYGAVHIALYTVKRGNRRVYAHLDVIEPAGQTGELLSTELQTKGFSWLPVRFVNGKPVNLAEVVQPLVEYLSEHVGSKIMLAGYVAQYDNRSLAELVEESRNNAVLLGEELLRAGIGDDRFEAAGVGPLLPLQEKISSPAIWVQER